MYNPNLLPIFIAEINFFKNIFSWHLHWNKEVSWSHDFNNYQYLIGNVRMLLHLNYFFKVKTIVACKNYF